MIFIIIGTYIAILRFAIYGFAYLCLDGQPGRKSFNFLPYSNSAGDIPMSLSGVFLCCSNALVTATLSKSPVIDVFSLSSLLALFTATSLRVFPCGNPTDETLW